MEGGEGWRMMRCAGGAEDKSVLNRTTLRFRPIAPKPVTGGSGSGESPTGMNNVLGSRGRSKRKYVRVRKNNRQEENGKDSLNDDYNNNNNNNNKGVVTLQLLPEIDKSSDNDHSKDGGSSYEINSAVSHSLQWLSLSKIGRDNCMRGDEVSDPTAVMGGVESWVSVECVRGTCMKAPQGFGVTSTDEERLRTLEGDTCPGFVSDGWNRVPWVNGAFRRMVMMTRQQQLPEFAVWLVMNEELPYTHSAFTCQVKLKYTVGKKEKCYYSQMVPCDLWRMDGGGFAWRLDVKAALTLGRLSNFTVRALKSTRAKSLRFYQVNFIWMEEASF